jgi:DnaJ homolog subfamily B member 11
MTEEEEIQLSVDVPAGMHHGEEIKFEGVADELVGHLAGDLIFTIQQIPHPYFVRHGDDIHTAIDISLRDSLLGFVRTLEHLDGHAVVVDKKDVSYCGEVFTVRGEGMPKRGTKARGDMHITLQIVFPTTFSASQRELLNKAFAM